MEVSEFTVDLPDGMEVWVEPDKIDPETITMYLDLEIGFDSVLEEYLNDDRVAQITLDGEPYGEVSAMTLFAAENCMEAIV